MEEPLKRRLVGAAVLASLAVIFIPMLLEDPPPRAPEVQNIPPRPAAVPFASEQLNQEVPASITRTEPRPRPVPVLKEEKEPERKPAVQSKTGLTAWIVQVGSFGSQQNAARLVKKLRKAGFAAPDAERAKVNGKTVYRVKVGPFLEKKRATQILAKVSKTAGVKAQVRRYP